MRIDQSRASSLLKVYKDCLGIPSFWIPQYTNRVEFMHGK